MLKPEFTGQFKRDYKLAVKRGCNPKKLEEVITLLCNEQPLPEAYRDHALTNSRNYKDMRDRKSTRLNSSHSTSSRMPSSA